MGNKHEAVRVDRSDVAEAEKTDNGACPLLPIASPAIGPDPRPLVEVSIGLRWETPQWRDGEPLEFPRKLPASDDADPKEAHVSNRQVTWEQHRIRNIFILDYIKQPGKASGLGLTGEREKRRGERKRGSRRGWSIEAWPLPRAG